MKSLLVLSVTLLIFVGCKDSGVLADDYSHIPDPRARWRAYGIRDYVIEQEVWCFCRPAFGNCLVYVNEDTVSDVRNLPDSTSILALVKGRYRTVEQLFEVIAENKNADRLEVEYHPKFGYPSRIFFDYFDIVDEELKIVTKGLQRMR